MAFPTWLRAASTFAAAAAFLLASPASAQSTPFVVAANATWKQEEAKFSMPPAIAGQQRDGVVDYGNDRLNVSATYRDRPTGTTTTLYLFRVAVPDVSLWHDRALASIRPHDVLGAPDHASARTTAFAPPHSDVDGGLRTILPLSGGQARSTGLALFAQGSWLVKVRMSSRDLDLEQLEARLTSFVAGLSLEPLGERQAPVAAMTECTAALRISNAERAARPGMTTLLALSVGVSAAMDKENESAGTETETPAVRPEPLCRDPSSQPTYGVYRRDGEDGYIIGFGDAGVSAFVGRQEMAGLIEERAGRDFLVSLSTSSTTSFYRGFRSLPRPEQVVRLIEDERPLTSVDRNADGGSTINLTTD